VQQVEWTESECRRYADDARRMKAHFALPWARLLAEQIGARWSGRVVDLACGPGLVSMEIARLVPGARITLVDQARPMLEIAGEEARDLGVEVDTVCSPAERVDLPDGCADVVVMKHLLLHADDVDAAIGEMHRMLAPVGRAFVVDFDPDRPAPLAWLIWLGARVRFGAYRAGRFWWGWTHAYPLPRLLTRLEGAGFGTPDVRHRNVNYVITARRASD